MIPPWSGLCAKRTPGGGARHCVFRVGYARRGDMRNLCVLWVLCLLYWFRRRSCRICRACFQVSNPCPTSCTVDVAPAAQAGPEWLMSLPLTHPTHTHTHTPSTNTHSTPHTTPPSTTHTTTQKTLKTPNPKNPPTTPHTHLNTENHPHGNHATHPTKHTQKTNHNPTKCP